MGCGWGWAGGKWEHTRAEGATLRCKQQVLVSYSYLVYLSMYPRVKGYTFLLGIPCRGVPYFAFWVFQMVQIGNIAGAGQGIRGPDQRVGIRPEPSLAHIRPRVTPLAHQSLLLYGPTSLSGLLHIFCANGCTQCRPRIRVGPKRGAGKAQRLSFSCFFSNIVRVLVLLYMAHVPPASMMPSLARR